MTLIRLRVSEQDDDAAPCERCGQVSPVRIDLVKDRRHDVAMRGCPNCLTGIYAQHDRTLRSPTDGIST